jgi:hypothetical protein
MVNETGSKKPKGKALKLALNGLGWADVAIQGSPIIQGG